MAARHGVFDIHTIAGNFPATADTMLIDTRLTDEPEASSRMFRVYTPLPPHYHATCDEYLLVVSGRASVHTLAARSPGLVTSAFARAAGESGDSTRTGWGLSNARTASSSTPR